MASIDKLAAPVVVKNLSEVKEIKIPVSPDTLVMVSMTHDELLRVWTYLDRAQRKLVADRAKYLQDRGGERERSGGTLPPISMTLHAYMQKTVA